MRDRDIAADIAAGDPEGLAAAYDAYAADLYGYCRSVLGEPSDAADAVQDTFIIAAARLGDLRNQGRLRSWLYAVARNESQARLQAGAWPAQPGTAGVPAGAGGPGGAAGRGQDELRSLILDALARLTPDEREAAELSRRHGLDDGDLAGVLGVPATRARALVARTSGRLARPAGTLVVAGTGEGTCPGLDALLDGGGGRPAVAWRIRAGRHLNSCPACGRRRRQVLSPAVLRRLLPLPPLPDGLREHVLWLVPDDSPEAVSYRDEVAARAGPFDPAGFPVQIAPAGRAGQSGRSGRRGDGAGPGRGRAGGRPATRRLAVAAALLLLVGGGGIAALVLHGREAGRAPADAAGTIPLSPPSARVPGSAAPARAPAPGPARLISPSPGSSSRPAAPARPGTPSAAPAPPSSAPARAQPPAPPRSAPAPPPVLSESPGTVTMTEGGTNEWSGSFTLTAANGPVSFSISALPGLGVSQPSGTVRPGAPVTISVSYVSGLLPTFPGSLSVNSTTVSITYAR